MKKIKILFIKTCSVLLGVFFFTNANAQVGPIIWEDDFDSFNTELWNITTGNGCDEGNCGWGNEELEYYLEDNVYIEPVDGEVGNYALVLEAKNETYESNSFTSGKVTTENKLAIKYGVIEIRMKVPAVETGLWPAAWLLGTNENAFGWPKCGEADMMEMGYTAAERARLGHSDVSANNYVGANLIWYEEAACATGNEDCAASIAYDAYYQTPYVSASALSDRFVIYRMYWDEESIRLTVEDNTIEYDFYASEFPITTLAAAFQKPFYMLMNLAVGGNFTDASTPDKVTATLPAKMVVDYIRVRKWNGQGEIFSGDDIMANAGINVTIDEGEDVVLNGSGSYGNISRYSWTVDGAEVATEVNPTLSGIQAGVHSVVLTVADAQGNTESDEITVTVGDSELGEIIWEENFSSFNTDLWNTTTGDGCAEGNCGWGNNELEYYLPDNVSIEAVDGEDGNYALVLEAKSETYENSSFTSGKVTTKNKVEVKYGIVEVRVKVPNLVSGLWPAAWLLGANEDSVGWPTCGEMDMMEMGHSFDFRNAEGAGNVSPNSFVGANLLWYDEDACGDDNPDCAASIAFDKYYTTQYVSSASMSNRFMIYRMYWDESTIRFTAVDNGVEYDLYTQPFPIGEDEAAFQQPFYFILDLAVGGNFTGFLNADDITAPLPAKMYIDYIRVRKYNGKGEVAYNGGPTVASAGEDFSITDLDRDGSEAVTLNGKKSFGDVVSYEWYDEGAQIAKGDSTTVTLLNGVHYITLKTTDTEGNVSTDKIIVDVQEIVWEDNFDSFNAEFWNKEIGDGCPDNCGWGNGELEYYQENNVLIEDVEGETDNKALVLKAQSESVGGKSFTSGKISSKEKVNFRYGIYEVKMKVPEVEVGLWPAAWLLGADPNDVGWPACGEIDIMEMGHSQTEIDRQAADGTSANNYVAANLIWYEESAVSDDNPTGAASIANDVYYNNPYVSESPLNQRYVIYRMYWSDRYIKFTVEDEGEEHKLYSGSFGISESSAAYREPFYFLLDLAVGGNFTDASTNEEVTAPLPGKMMVDYVRVKKWLGKAEVSFGDGLTANAGPDAIVIDKNGDGFESITLDGTGSFDHNGTIESYSWTIEDTEVADEVTPTLKLNRGLYEIALTITDDDGNTASDTVIINICSGGLEPSAVAGNDTTVYDDDDDDLVSFSLDASKSTPTNTAIVSWLWLENDSEIATGVNPTVILSTGIHVLDLIVTDEEGLTGVDKITITVIDPDNIAPIANAGADASYEDDDGDDWVTLTLDGSASSDSDGTIDDYKWYNNKSVIAEEMTATVDLSTGIYNLTLMVTDNDGVTNFDQVSITVIDPDNIAPIANAGDDMLLVDTNRDGSQSYTLDASASSDSDGQIVDYLWEENGMEIGNEVSVSVDFTIGTHTISLTTTDDDGVSNSDDVVIKVHQEPIAMAGDDIFVQDSDANGNEDILLDGSLSTDPYGMVVSYSWSENEVEIATGVNINHTFDVGTHDITLVVTDDDGAFATDDIQIIVASIDNIDPVAVAGDDIVVMDEDYNNVETISLNGSGSSDSDGSIYSYIWFENGAEIASGDRVDVEFESGTHEIVLLVTDNEGATNADSLTVTVTRGCVLYPDCYDDFKIIVVSEDASNTTSTFVPLESGVGDTYCELYYRINGSSNNVYEVQPYEAYTITGLAMGDSITVFYKYNTVNDVNVSTVFCKVSFFVGECGLISNEAPIADAGDDIDVEDADNNGYESVKLNGSGSSDPEGSSLYYMWNEDATVIATSNVSSTYVKLNVGTHTITLNVFDDLGGKGSDELTVTVLEGTGIANVDASIELKIYPSPVNQVLNIETNRGYIERVQLFNSLGMKVFDQVYVSQVDMSELSPGIYTIQVTVDKESIIRKVIKK
jgi:beta-glucanase (GH16 family)